MRSKKNSRKLLIGVTGGIGSGKSLVCGHLKELGGEIFWADKIARDLYVSNKRLSSELIKEFGSKILDEDKKISFPKFREVVFSSDKNQKRVNSIVHPFVIKEILSRAGSSKSKLIFIEAALIFESGFDKYLDYTIEVFASKARRAEWVKRRSKLSKVIINAIMKLQMPEKEKLEKADFVLKNNSTKQDLKKKAEFIFNLLTRI